MPLPIVEMPCLRQLRIRARLQPCRKRSCSTWALEAAEKIRKADSSRAKSPLGIIKINHLDAGLKAGSTKKRFFQQPVKPLSICQRLDAGLKASSTTGATCSEFP